MTGDAHNDEVVALLVLSQLSGIGERRRERLLGAFGTARAALAVPESEWPAVVGLGADAVAAARRSADWQRARGQLASLQARGGRATLLQEEGYPHPLRQLTSPPPVLFALGGPALTEPGVCVALVGTRRPSRSGTVVARRLAAGLAVRGVCVVSGMARGIDAAAHEGALEARGRTIAVLGSGVDVVTPVSNSHLYARIERQGTVVSDLPPGAPASTHTFPRRNRIISGLSLGIVVVEAPRVSGALITARNAVEQGRRLFAVPGDVAGGKSAGCHRLIREGAQLVEGADEIVEALRPSLPADFELTSPAIVPAPDLACALEPQQRRVLARLGVEPLPVDALAAASGLRAPEILDVLSRLELAGLVDQLPGKRFCRSE